MAATRAGALTKAGGVLRRRCESLTILLLATLVSVMATIPSCYCLPLFSCYCPCTSAKLVPGAHVFVHFIKTTIHAFKLSCCYSPWALASMFASCACWSCFPPRLSVCLSARATTTPGGCRCSLVTQSQSQHHHEARCLRTGSCLARDWPAH